MRSIGVNSRRVAFTNDVVTTIPCASPRNSRLASMPACPLAPIPTGRDVYGDRVYFWDDYQHIAGTVEFTPAELPVQRDSWKRTEMHVPVWGDLPHAAHTCSYACFASQWVADNTHNSCLLADPPLEGYSYCRGFPPTSNAQRRRATNAMRLGGA